MPPLLCPLCRGEVATASSGCLACHLPMLDVLRHQRTVPSPTGALERPVRRRWFGLVVFVLIVVVVALLWPSMLTGAFSDATNG